MSRRLSWCLILLLALTLCFFENNTGTRIITAGTILLPLSSIFLAWMNRKRIQLLLVIPEEVSAHGRICGRVVFRKPAGLAGFGVQAVVTGTHSLIDRQWHWRASLSSRSGYEIEAADIPCGAVEFYLDSVETVDIFGLWSFPVECTDRALCLIRPVTYPVTLEIQNPALERVNESSASVRRKGQNAYEMSGVRQYLPGDPVRDIHWKLSARTDTLLLREGEEQTEPCPLLCLDQLVSPDGTDELLSAFASVSEAFLDTGMPYGIGWRSGFHRIIRSREEQLLALDRLLTGHFMPDSFSADEDAEELERYTLLLLFTDHPEDLSDLPDPDMAGMTALRICADPENMTDGAVLVNRSHPYLELVSEDESL